MPHFCTDSLQHRRKATLNVWLPSGIILAFSFLICRLKRKMLPGHIEEEKERNVFKMNLYVIVDKARDQNLRRLSLEFWFFRF